MEDITFTIYTDYVLNRSYHGDPVVEVVKIDGNNIYGIVFL